MKAGAFGTVWMALVCGTVFRAGAEGVGPFGRPNLLTNPGFEVSECADHDGSWGWFIDGKVTAEGWTGGGHAGLSKRGGTTWRPDIEGEWTAFVQMQDTDDVSSFIEQTVTVAESGNHKLSFLYATRYDYHPSAGEVGVSVSDGTKRIELPRIAFTTHDHAFRRAVYDLVLEAGTRYTIRIYGVAGRPEDRTLLIDRFALERVPAEVKAAEPLDTLDRVRGNGTPTLHVTDLFRPHGDPDDHWDLAVQFALAKHGAIDLRGVLIDYPRRQGEEPQPDVAAVAQLNWITGLAVPTGVGQPKKTGLPPRSGLALLKKTLEEAGAPVAIHVVGACSDVAEAGTLWPELFRTKVKGIYLNAGNADDSGEMEWNVKLDPKPYAQIFRLPCPIYWLPCWNRPGKRGRNGSYWVFRQDRAFAYARPETLNYFVGMLGKRPATEWLKMIEGPVDHLACMAFGRQNRNMWCTAGFLHAAGLAVRCDGTIARLGGDTGKAVCRFIPIEVTCTEEGRTAWKPSAKETGRFIIDIVDESVYDEAMTRAITTLIQGL